MVCNNNMHFKDANGVSHTFFYDNEHLLTHGNVMKFVSGKTDFYPRELHNVMRAGRNKAK